MGVTLQPWQQPPPLDRRTGRSIKQRQQRAAVEDYEEERRRLVTSIRNEGGAILSGELNHFLEVLGTQQDRLQHSSPASAGRVGHVLDQLAINGAFGIGNYMRGTR